MPSPAASPASPASAIHRPAARSGASYLQLLEPTREDSAVGKWLAKNGEGVHHIAFGTADVDADSEAIRDKGVRVLYDEPRRGSMESRITFLHPKDCHGVLTELVTAAGQHGGAAAPDGSGLVQDPQDH